MSARFSMNAWEVYYISKIHISKIHNLWSLRVISLWKKSHRHFTDNQ